MKTTTLRRAMWLFAALPLTGCQQVFFAEVEVPQLCQKLPTQQFEGVPAELQFQGKLEREFDYSIEEFLGEADLSSLEGEAQLTTMSLKKLADSPALTFINAARVELLTPEGTELPVLKIIDYQKKPDEVGDELSFNGDKIDVLPYLRAGKVKLKAMLEGSMPSEPWAADVEACFYMRARYYYYDTLQSGNLGLGSGEESGEGNE
jgi:hypothetical protein